ncbi:MAG: MinD/ParA family protein [Candidatus Eisenbacteria bacterium]|nr:MinD/ParA family protein [Candidatus Eisenbacteria bacterium]MCC7142723.1 MinD/ParA family protein [Candidatus Eisenbacteria bacterium]
MSDQAEKLRRLRLIEGTAPSDSLPPFGPRPSARSIAVVSGKGGVGKSALVANLALALARRGKKVLLVDGDLSLANVDLLFGLVPKFNLGDVVFGQRTIEEILLTTPDGVRLLPAASGVEELADLDEFRRERLVRELSRLEADLDLLLIDTGSGIGSQTLHWARAADRTLVVTTPEPTAFADAYAMIKVLAGRKLRELPALLVNMVNSARDGRETARRIRVVSERFLGFRPELLGWVPFDDAFPRAVRQQEPLLRMFPHSPSALAISKIAEHLVFEPVPRDPIAVEPEGYFLKVANG